MILRALSIAFALAAAACSGSPHASTAEGAPTLAQAYAHAKAQAQAERDYAAVAHADRLGTPAQAAAASPIGGAPALLTVVAPAPTPTALAAAPVNARSVLFAIHLASYRSESSASAGWNLLADSPGSREALAGLGARLDRVDLGGDQGAFHRLKAGPLASRAEADARCAALRAAGAYCQVTDFEGRELGGGASYAQVSPRRADSAQ